ncbi:MAG: membrane dipeptidase [Candidatus Aminicenantes bacterium]|nr:MAG: membrane dipeptidase [Candidatus Aminicenantes bacterium]
MKRAVYFPLLIVLVLIFSCQQADNTLAERAMDIHDRVLTADTHVDTPYMLLQPGFDITKVNDRNQGGGQVDFPRMKQGGLDAVFFAVYMDQGDRTQQDFEAAVANAHERLTLLHETIQKHPDWVKLALTPDDAYRIEKEKKRAMFLSIENGYPMGLDLDLITAYYDRGVRMSGLCHSGTNEICDSATDEPEHGGLSDVGKEVVREMNRVGMLVDVSHISDEAFFDVVETSRVPVTASHSSSRAMCDSPRNMTDAMLEALAENGGVIQLCLLSSFIKKIDQDPRREEALEKLDKKYPERRQSEDEQKKYEEERREIDRMYPRKRATVADAVDHIDHIVELIGIDHVGIGSDFDGGGGLEDCMDASELGNVTFELVKRGYTEEQIRKIWGGNLMRIMREAQQFAEKDLVYHFGYGSNLSTKFLRQSCPNVKPVMKAYLPNFRVEFRFYSKTREGGISSIIEYPGEMTHGIIYSMPKKEMDELDIVESVPEGLYTRETFLVLGEDGKWHKADLYRVANPQGPFAPAKSYLRLMLEGAREHKMDPKFILWLESL